MDVFLNLARLRALEEEGLDHNSEEWQEEFARIQRCRGECVARPVMEASTRKNACDMCSSPEGLSAESARD